MKLTRKAIRDIVVDAIEEVTSSLTVDEDDEIADIVIHALEEDFEELFEDEDEDVEKTDETSEEE